MTFETIVTFYKKYRNFIIAGLMAIFLIGFALFLWGALSNYVYQRDIQRKQANVNAALNEANSIQTNVNADKAEANRIIENVNIATKEYLDATNATDHQRAITNQAIANMQKAANTSKNVNAADLEKILEGLDK